MHTGKGFTGGHETIGRREAGERGASPEEERELMAWSDTTPSCSDISTTSRGRLRLGDISGYVHASVSGPSRRSSGRSRAHRCAIGIRLLQWHAGQDQRRDEIE